MLLRNMLLKISIAGWIICFLVCKHRSEVSDSLKLERVKLASLSSWKLQHSSSFPVKPYTSRKDGKAAGFFSCHGKQTSPKVCPPQCGIRNNKTFSTEICNDFYFIYFFFKLCSLSPFWSTWEVHEKQAYLTNIWSINYCCSFIQETFEVWLVLCPVLG